MADVRSLLDREVDRIQVQSITMEGLRDRRQRRQQRKRATAGVVAVLLVVFTFGAVLRAIWSAQGIPASPHPTPTVVPIEERIVITPPPPGFEPVMTYKGVERYMLRQIAGDEERLGFALVPARVLSITFVPAGEPYRVNEDSNFSPSESDAWVVTFEGTTVVCTDWCSAHPGGSVMLRDGAPSAGGEQASLLDPVCIGPDLPGSSEAVPKELDLPSCAELDQNTGASAPELPEPAQLVHGGTAWGVYLTVAGNVDDPALEVATVDAAALGYQAGSGEIACDQPAAETLGVPSDAFTVAIYFDTRADAEVAAALFDQPPVGIAKVTTFCLD